MYVTEKNCLSRLQMNGSLPERGENKPQCPEKRKERKKENVQKSL